MEHYGIIEQGRYGTGHKYGTRWDNRTLKIWNRGINIEQYEIPRDIWNRGIYWYLEQVEIAYRTKEIYGTRWDSRTRETWNKMR